MSEKDPRHPGYRWLTPNLIVVDAKKSMEFYQQAFDFTEGYVGKDDGQIVHVTMQYHGKNIVMFNPEGQYCEQKAPVNSKIDLPINLYIYVDDVDQTIEKVKAAGGSIVVEPSDSFWGDRFAQVKDIDGYTWGLGHYLG